LWTETTTWSGGVVPTSLDNITVPASTILINNVPTATVAANNLSVNNFTINGTYYHSGIAAQNMNIYGDLTVGAGGVAHFAGATASGISTLNMYGNFVNNGFANVTATNLSWPSTNVGNRSITGTGTFAGDGTRGVIRTISAQCTGTFTVNTTQNLTTSSGLTATCATLVTNNKLRADNTAWIRENHSASNPSQ
jgi:hypothetical protein